ncbi:hypothetical protein HaLaN_28437 [Haematococcus lacustris]|uniref:Uncharacterized protein n=1 Tax=Haematococcus lacustris TaxID=44745 RepID=A0A6A0AAG5_HAELA|nr:hypothetical protein HaLaN_28437 [Haematococcus lacustris]
MKQLRSGMRQLSRWQVQLSRWQVATEKLTGGNCAVALWQLSRWQVTTEQLILPTAQVTVATAQVTLLICVSVTNVTYGNVAKGYEIV